jgi:FtsP/CotA-like multicopper oxidase with cupredoxin domain
MARSSAAMGPHPVAAAWTMGGAWHGIGDMGNMADGRHGSRRGMDMGGMGGMDGMAMDLNDYDWDAYLANDRTLSRPRGGAVERGGRIRLRVINAAAATVFWIETGTAQARLVAVDGHAVQPLTGNRFGLAMGSASISRSTCRQKAAPGRSSRCGKARASAPG